MDIDEGGRAQALALAPGQAGQGVRGLAGLADRHGQGARRQRRLAVAELRGDLDVAGQVGQFLERITPDLAGIEGGAAGNDLQAVDGGEVRRVRLGLAVHEVEVVREGVLDAVRLLMDLLFHEVPVLALLDEGRGGGDLDDRPGDSIAADVEHPRAAAVEADVVAFLEVGDLRGERSDRQGVRAEIHLAFAPADHQGAAAPGTEDQSVLALDQDRERIGTGQPVEHALERHHRVVGGFERAVQQMRHHLGVGLALEDAPLQRQYGFQLGEILDDPVVHQHHASRLVGVGVHRGRSTVGGPTRVADADRGGQRLGEQHRLQFPDLALGPTPLDATVDQGGHAGGVIAPVFQPLQAVDQTGNGRANACHANDAAHGLYPRDSGFPRFAHGRWRV